MCLPRQQDYSLEPDPDIFFLDLLHIETLGDIPQIIVSPPSPPPPASTPSHPEHIITTSTGTIDEVSMLLAEVPLLVDLADYVPPIRIEGDYTEADLQQMEPELADQHRQRLNRIETLNNLMSDTRDRLRMIEGILQPYTPRRSNLPSI